MGNEMIRGLGAFLATVLLAWAAPFGAAAATSRADDDPDDPVLRAMEREVARAMAGLADQAPPPYFLAVEVTETRGLRITGEEGGLQGYAPTRSRWVDVDVRAGGPGLDSTHALRSGRDRSRKHGRQLALDDDVDVLRRGIWREIDRRFLEAQERWAAVESDRQVLVEEEPAEDLAAVEPVRAVLPRADLDIDLTAWEETVRRTSRLLAESEVVHDGSVQLAAEAETRWFVSSEGTRLRHPRIHLRVSVRVDTVADDGEVLRLHHAWDAHGPAGLPAEGEIASRVREMEVLLAELREAPEQDPYTGPALLTGRAAAVFFHEILGHRLEGHRLKRVDDAQTFRGRVGEAILPEFLSVHDDPAVARSGTQDLNGHYTFDSQGVPGLRTTLVDHGELVDFLQSRSPVRRGEHSNGHGRRQRGFDAVTRQGNLLVEASETMDEAALRRELLRRATAAGLEYGLQLEDIQGGFTLTGRKMPNAFDVKVVTARRVYADGRPDELVRGVDLIGTPLVTFGQIVAAGDRPEVFNGSCGAESGWVPVSAVAPPLLLAEVETQRKSKGQDTPPLLPPPRPVAPGSATGEEVSP